MTPRELANLLLKGGAAAPKEQSWWGGLPPAAPQNLEDRRSDPVPWWSYLGMERSPGDVWGDMTSTLSQPFTPPQSRLPPAPTYDPDAVASPLSQQAGVDDINEDMMRRRFMGRR